MGGGRGRLWVSGRDGEGQTPEGLPTRNTGEPRQGLDILTAPLMSCAVRNPKSPARIRAPRRAAISRYEISGRINKGRPLLVVWEPDCGLDCSPTLAGRPCVGTSDKATLLPAPEPEGPHSVVSPKIWLRVLLPGMGSAEPEECGPLSPDSREPDIPPTTRTAACHHPGKLGIHLDHFIHGEDSPSGSPCWLHLHPDRQASLHPGTLG